MPEIERLRRTFNEDAVRYDRCRPGYPQRLFDDLVSLVGLGPGSRVLEIGCGTGQATLPLARLGCAVTAVDLGADMVAVARRKLTGFGDVELVVSTFEDWPLPAEGFDLVLSATAFHWIDPAVRVVKSADALRDNGALAIVSTHHVAGGTEPFFVAAQRYYERFMPGTPPGGLRLPSAAEVPSDPTEHARSGRFGAVEFRRYERDLSYTAGEYVDLLSTYSGHRAMPDAQREDFLGGIRRLIDDGYGGRITKRYLTELAIARRH